MTESAGRARLIALIERLPRRIEPLGGQRTSYVQLDNVLAILEALAGQEPSDEKRNDQHLRAFARDIGLHFEDGRETDEQLRGCLYQTFRRLMALAGQEEAPQQKYGEEEDHARGGSFPGTEQGDLPQSRTGDSSTLTRGSRNAARLEP